MAGYSKIVLAFLSVLLLTGIADALTSTYEAQTNWNMAVGNTAGEEHGQNVTLSYAHRDNVFLIRAFLQREGTPDNLTVKLYNQYANGSIGSVLRTWTLPYTSVNLTADWVTIASDAYTFSDPDHQNYLFTVSGGVNASNHYDVYFNGTDNYSKGIMFTYSGGSWTSYPEYDMMFEFDWQYNQEVSGNPGHVSPANGSTNVSLTPTFEFNSITDPDSDTPIRYWVTSDALGTSPYAGCDGVTTTNCTVSTPLSEGTTYSWYTYALDNWCYDHGGCGKAVSTGWTFMTLTNTTGAPITNLSAIAWSDSYITWNWTNPTYSGFNKTMIYKGTTPTNGVWVANVSNTSHTVNFLSLDPATNYTISTRTVNDAGEINQTWVNATFRTNLACSAGEICQLEIAKTNPISVSLIGNTFKITGVAAPITIDYIRVAMMRGTSNTSTSTWFYITNTSAGLPDSVLASESTSNAGISNTSIEFVPLFTGSLVISPDVEYAFYIEGGGVEIVDYVYSSGGNDYINGNLVLDNGTGWVANSSDDVAFIIGYIASPVAAANETYVKWNGSDSNIGTSWAYAFRNISFAVNYTTNYSTSLIHIAPGNYSADPPLTKRTKARFKCDTTGAAQNISQIWCSYPRWNMTQW